MSRPDRYDSRLEARLSSALHDLASSAPQSASQTTRATLEREFRSHHRRRRAIRASAVLVIGVIVFGGWLGVHTLSRNKVDVTRVNVATPPPAASSKADPPAQEQHDVPQVQAAKLSRRIAHSSPSLKEPSFLALPAYALAMPDEDLRMVRVEMPLSSLRMLGARVNDEPIPRNVVADLLVGADGTPYAFRIIG